MIRTASLFVIFLWLCAGCQHLMPHDQGNVSGVAGVRYFNLQEKTWLNFEKESLGELVGVFADAHEELGYSVKSCGTSQYDCLSFGSIVLAAPRIAVSEESVFEAGGARFKILACANSKCSSFVAESRCAIWRADDSCEISNGNLVTANEGSTVYYVFDEQRGITSISNEINCTQEASSARCILGGAFHFELQGERGLFAE